MIVIKTIISILIIITGALIGNHKSKKFIDRKRILEEAVILFSNMKSNMTFRLVSIPDAIESARVMFKTQLRDVLGAITTMMLDKRIDEKSILTELENIYCLKEYDRQLISNTVYSLGSSSLEGEIGILDLAITKLTKEAEEAQEEKIKNSKLYKTVGLVFGIMLVIIFV